MINNPFWKHFRLSGKKSNEMAVSVGLSLPTLRKVVGRRELADHLKLGTLRVVAADLNRRVVITLEPLNSEIKSER